MSLDDIVNVQISLESPSITRAGFGVPAILDFNTKFAELARVYDSTAAMADDLFGPSDAAYVAAQKVFGQNPHPGQVVVLRRPSGPVMRWEITPTVENLAAYTGKLHKLGTAEETFLFTSDGTATLAEIIAGLVAAINALVGNANFTATDQVTHVRVDGDAAGTHLLLKALSSNLSVKNATPDSATIVTHYTAAASYAQAQGFDYYGLVSTSRGSAELSALAAQIEGEKKILGFATQDTPVKEGTAGNIALTLQAAAYARTFGVFNEAGDGIYSFAEAGLFGRVLPDDPGSETWKFKTLAGVSVDALTSTNVVNLKTADINHYRREAGNNFTAEGVTFAGEFIDVTRFIDFIHARMQENIFARLVAVEKVPFTDPGIAIVENEIRGVLQLGINNGGFASDPAPTVTVPRAADVSAVDKGNRFLPDLKFSATLAGAIHSLDLNGTVSV
jgi:hypothetical protein